MSWATCHTADCENEDIPIDVGSLEETDEETGQVRIMACSCGVCQQLITDISDTAPPMPEPEEEDPGV